MPARHHVCSIARTALLERLLTEHQPLQIELTRALGDQTGAALVVGIASLVTLGTVQMMVLRKKRIAGDEHMLASGVVSMAERDEHTLRALQTAATGIGKAIAPYVAALNPEVIVLGGALGSRAFRLVLDDLTEKMTERDASNMKNITVVGARLQRHTATRGATALALLELGPAYLNGIAAQAQAATAAKRKRAPARPRPQAARRQSPGQRSVAGGRCGPPNTAKPGRRLFGGRCPGFLWQPSRPLLPTAPPSWTPLVAHREGRNMGGPHISIRMAPPSRVATHETTQ